MNKISRLVKVNFKLLLILRNLITTLIKIVCRNKPHYVEKLADQMMIIIEKFNIAMMNGFNGPSFNDSPELQARNQAWQKAHEAYGAQNFDVGEKWLQRADSIEDQVSAEMNIEPNQVRIVGPHILGSIGHTFGGLSIRATLQELSMSPVKHFWLLSSPDVNTSFIEYWRKYFSVVPVSVEQRDSIEETFWSLGEKISSVRTDKGTIEHRKIHNEIAKIRFDSQMSPLLELSEQHRQAGDKFLAEAGLKKFDWFAVMHVRDTGDKTYGRNADINNYLPAVNHVAKKGGVVFRIGDQGMPKIQEVPGLIDLTQVSKKPEWLDLYLVAKAKFMLATTSGPQFLAYCFNTPMIWTNAPDIGNALYFPNAIMLPKLFQDVTGNILSLNQMINSSAIYSDNLAGTYLDSKGFNTQLSWKDNSSEDIEEAVEDFLDKGFLENKSVYQKKWVKSLSNIHPTPITNIGARFAEKWDSVLFR